MNISVNHVRALLRECAQHERDGTLVFKTVDDKYLMGSVADWSHDLQWISIKDLARVFPDGGNTVVHPVKEDSVVFPYIPPSYTYHVNHFVYIGIPTDKLLSLYLKDFTKE